MNIQDMKELIRVSRESSLGILSKNLLDDSIISDECPGNGYVALTEDMVESEIRFKNLVLDMDKVINECEIIVEMYESHDGTCNILDFLDRVDGDYSLLLELYECMLGHINEKE